MASEKELKEIIVQLKLDLVRANIPIGNCPYAYYSTSKRKGRENCDDTSCSACSRKFIEDIENDIREEIAQL